MNKEDSYYTKLRNRFSFILVVVALVPLLVISWSSSKLYQRCGLRNTERFLKMATEHRVDDVERFLEDQKNMLFQLVNLYSLQELKDQQLLEKVFASFTQSFIVDLGVIDDTGQHVAYVGPYRQKLSDKNYATADWFHEVMVNGWHISDVFLGYREVPHIIIAVTDPLKQFILRATINSEYFDRLLRNFSLGPTGDAFIINQKGEYQTAISRRAFKILNSFERQLVDYHDGSEITMHGKDMYVTRWLKDKQWMMVLKLHTPSVLEAYYVARNFDILVILVAMVIVATVATLIMRNMVSKIETLDRKKARMDSHMVQVEKMASLGRLAAGIAHEVNNPLQLITDQAGWIGELIEEEDPEAVVNYEEYIRSIDKIKYHVRRASSVTHRLLGFSRKMETERESVNINALIDECASFLENEANNNNIQIVYKFQEDLPTTMTDASRLQQVILNLLNNSMDAIEKNGVVEVTTSGGESSIQAVFADTGPGINPEIIEKIFDPFFTTKAPEKGTGLGLSICYSIMHQLGGDIKVRNREKGGAEFTIIVPLVKLGEGLE